MTGQDTVHLDRLALALARAGWVPQERYGGTPPLLRVFLSESVGESVRVKPGVGGVPWFVSSTGDPLAPCHDTARAVVELAARLGTSARAAGVLREKATLRRSVPWRRLLRHRPDQTG